MSFRGISSLDGCGYRMDVTIFDLCLLVYRRILACTVLLSGVS